MMLGLAVSACGTAGGVHGTGANPAVTGSIAPASITPIAYTPAGPDCASLEASIDQSVQQMANKLAEAKKAEAGPPANLVQAYQRLVGPPGAGNPAFEQYQQERTRVAGLNADRAAKGCAPIDVDQRLARTPPEPQPEPKAPSAAQSAAKSADAGHAADPRSGEASGFGLGQRASKF